MSSRGQTYTFHSEGIFHGLPVVPADLTGLKAVVVGASGQSGQPLVDVLGANPQRWAKVFALSRKAPVGTANSSNVEHVPVNLLWEPEKISAALMKQKVQADYVFYFGYAQLEKSEESDSAIFGDAEHLASVNGLLFENLLTALDQASVQPKRIVLQTGGKNYGVHQGHVNVPLREGAPRVELEPNFYYTQEDILSKYVQDRPGVSYNVTMPQWILGAVGGTNMTIFYPLGVYVAVQQRLKKPLHYPGDIISWDNHHPISTGFLNARFYEWLVLSEHTVGESFNITDGSEFTFGGFWPILASWYRVEWYPPKENAKYDEIEMPFVPRGYGPKGRLRSTFSFIDWAQEPAVREAWAGIKEDYGLATDPFKDPEKTFAFLQFALTLTWSWQTSVDKARKYGWFGHCDSVESMRMVFEKFAKMKMLPPIPH